MQGGSGAGRPKSGGAEVQGGSGAGRPKSGGAEVQGGSCAGRPKSGGAEFQGGSGAGRPKSGGAEAQGSSGAGRLKSGGAEVQGGSGAGRPNTSTGVEPMEQGDDLYGGGCYYFDGHVGTETDVQTTPHSVFSQGNQVHVTANMLLNSVCEN